MISVAGWNRQLSRARRHRRYVGPNTGASGSHGQGGSNGANVNGDHSGISGVASQMMDAADQRLPTLSVNARRKFFHALAVVMFVPGIAFDVRSTRVPFPLAVEIANPITARLHPPGLLRRVRRIQLCRVYPIFRPMAFWSQRSSVLE